MERLHDITLDAKFNDARSKAKGEGNEMLPTDDPRRCWKPPVDFFRTLKLEDRMPGYNSIPEHEGKEKINTEPMGVPQNPFDIGYEQEPMLLSLWRLMMGGDKNPEVMS